MKQLISVRTNIFYLKTKPKDEKEEPKFKKFIEVILLLDKSEYEKTNDNEVIRKRGVSKVKFTVNEDSLSELINLMEGLKTLEDYGLE